MIIIPGRFVAVEGSTRGSSYSWEEGEEGEEGEDVVVIQEARLTRGRSQTEKLEKGRPALVPWRSHVFTSFILWSEPCLVL